MDTRSLDHQEVHVWHAALDHVAWAAAARGASLSADENARAERYRFDRDRLRFIVRRSVLRALLSLYTGAAPQDLRFDYTALGKPTLAGPERDHDVRFNMSHSGEVAVYAFSRGRELGIDVEKVRGGLNVRELATRYFAGDEVTALLSLPPALQCEAFFHGWTSKEAYIKAIGLGLSCPLDAFAVSLAPREPPALLWSRVSPGESGRWSLRSIEAGQGYKAVIAVEGKRFTLTFETCVPGNEPDP